MSDWIKITYDTTIVLSSQKCLFESNALELSCIEMVYSYNLFQNCERQSLLVVHKQDRRVLIQVI